MRLTLILLLAVFIPEYAFPQVPEGYRVDTVYKESAVNPGVFDTVIVYKKINVVIHPLVLTDTIVRKVNYDFYAGIAAGYSYAGKGDKKPLNEATDLISDKAIFRTADVIAGMRANNLVSEIWLGIDQTEQHFTAFYKSFTTTEVKSVVDDTVDVYYVEVSPGVKEPVYVVKKKNISRTDTAYSVSQNNFTNKIIYSHIRLNIGYNLHAGRFRITPVVGYKLSIPMQAEGSFSGNYEPEKLEISHLRKVVSAVTLELGLAYPLSKMTEVFLRGNFLQQLSPMYNTNTPRLSLLGLNGGVVFNLRG